ncbi:hypothetical protein D3C72_2185300 [compost metagenome]
MGKDQPDEAAIDTQQRKQAQQRHTEYQVRNNDRRQKQAVEKVSTGKLESGDRQRGGHRDQRRQGGGTERQDQAVVERIDKIGTLEHRAKPA